MSFFTNFLNTIPHFESSIEGKEAELKATRKLGRERLQLLVELAYCYAYVQLQKGQAAAEEAIAIAESINDQKMKGNALCAKAMNLLRIGYTSSAQATALQALSIFENIIDEEGKCDAYFQLGSMPYLSIGPNDTYGNLEKAYESYAVLGDKTGIYLVRIQKSMQLYLMEYYEDASHQLQLLLKELSAPYQRHLVCFVNMQLSLGMHIKQDLIQFMNNTLAWQKVALANGNFHDYCMTKAMLTDGYRYQHLDHQAMQACLVSIECCERLGSIHGHSTVAIVMAHILSGLLLYEDALSYYQKAMDAAQEIEDGYKYLMALNATGEIYLKLGKNQKAYEVFQIARQRAIVANDRINLIAAQRHLAELAYKQGEFDRALFEFKLFFEEGKNSDGWNVQDYGNYAASIAKASDAALLKAGIKIEEKFTLRLRYLERFMKLAQLQENKREEVNAYGALAEYYEEMNDLTKVIQYLKKYISLYQELVQEQNMESIAKLRFQYESKKKEQEMQLLRKENDEALLNERLRISRDLHDDMGSTLGSISIYSEVAKNRSAKNEDAEEAIVKIGIASRKLIDKMNDIIWSINPKNESFEQLKTRMQVFAATMLTPLEIAYDFYIDEYLMNIRLTAEQRKNIYLIYKEAICNIVKYASCSLVKIKIVLIDGRFILSIQDNGKGFDTNKVYEGELLGGNGIENMKTRAKIIKANFNISSIVSKGTAVEINLNT
ncbi:MAG: histidine kinase [Ferruginibacter sp.]